MNENSFKKFFPRLTEIVFIIILLFIYLKMGELKSFDIFWHSKTGEYISVNKTIPLEDPFSVDFIGKKWIAHEYLADVVFWKIRDLFGIKGLIFFKNILFIIVLFVLLKTLQYKKCQNFTIIIFIIFVFSCSVSMAIVRPHIFSILFISILFYLINRFKEKSNLFWILCGILFVFWVQLHGGYIFGLVIIGIYCFSQLVDKQKITKDWAGFVFCILCCLINPNGYHILLYPFEYVSNSHHTEFIMEWRKIDFNKFEIIPFQIFLFLTLTGMIFSKKRVKHLDFFLYFAFLFSGLKSERNIHVFVLVASFVSCEYLGSALFSLKKTKRFFENFEKFENRELTLISGKLIPVIIVVLMLFSNRIVLSEIRYPIKGIEFISSCNEIKNKKIFNQYEWGGIIIDRFYDVLEKRTPFRVWIDGRADLYGYKRMEMYDRIINAKRGFESQINNFEVFFIRTDSLLKKHLEVDNNFIELYTDNLSSVFKKKS